MNEPICDFLLKLSGILHYFGKFKGFRDFGAPFSCPFCPGLSRFYSAFTRFMVIMADEKVVCGQGTAVNFSPVASTVHTNLL